MVPFYGFSILCWDDTNSRDILGDIDSVCLTYGLEEGASLRGVRVRRNEGNMNLPLWRRLSELRTCIDVVSEDERLGVTGPLGQLEVKALGVHNVRNALAACCVGLCLDQFRHCDGSHV